MTENKTLYAKMARIMGELNNLPKDSVNKFHNYKYTSAETVLSTIRTKMASENMAFFAETVNVETQDVRYVITYRFTFACGDTGATMTVNWAGEAVHTTSKDKVDDKALNKAATTAQKYFLLKTFLIGTGDDLDVDASTTETTRQRNNSNGHAPPQSDKLQLLREAIHNIRGASPTDDEIAGYLGIDTLTIEGVRSATITTKDGEVIRQPTIGDIAEYVARMHLPVKVEVSACHVRPNKNGVMYSYETNMGPVTSFTREEWRDSGWPVSNWNDPGNKITFVPPVRAMAQTRPTGRRELMDVIDNFDDYDAIGGMIEIEHPKTSYEGGL